MKNPPKGTKAEALHGDFFEPHGDEPLIRYITGEDDAAAVAGRSRHKLKELRAVALALLSLPDVLKLLVAIRILKQMQGKRRGGKYDDAVNDLLRAWGGLEAALLDAAGPTMVGKLCWRMADTHSVDWDKGSLEKMEQAEDAARKHAEGRTWDEIGEAMRISGDALKKSQQARREKQAPRVREE